MVNQQEAAQRPPPRSAATFLRRYLAPYTGRTLLLLLLLLVGTAETLLGPPLLAAFIDAVFQAAPSAQLLLLGGAFLGLALTNQAITIASNYLGTDIGLRATNQVRADLTLHCLQLDMAFHHATTPGTLIERIDGDVSRLNQFLSTFAVLLLRNALLLVGSLVALFLIDWRAGLAVALFVVVTLATLDGLRRVSLPGIRREREASAQLFGLIEERLSATEDLRANGMLPYTMQRFSEQSRIWTRHTIVSHMLGALPSQAAAVLFIASLALALGLGAWLLGAGAITIGGAYALYRYVELMHRPVHQIGRQFQDLQQASAATERIEQLLAEQSSLRNTGVAQLAAGALAVRFADVRFAYNPTLHQATLHDLSFALAPGQVLGLLGRTGSGKSTIARLLTRQYEAQQGSVTLNGTALADLHPAVLRARVSLVTQDVQLFAASVRDNLTLFDPNIADEQLLAALRTVELWDWYQTLPQGLDSVLPSGGGMSAGQAQLLAFARVLLRDPGLIILDEASARLDPATERRLEVALDRLLAGRTAIIIAHRLATLQRADLVLVLEDGQRLEFGPRTVLASDPTTRFAQLLHAGMEEILA